MLNSILYELRTPVVLLNGNNIIVYINATGEEFFGLSSNLLIGKSIDSIIQKNSPLLILLARVRKNKSGLTEERLDISNVSIQNRKVRVHLVPLPEDTNKIIIQINPFSVSETFQSQRVNSKISKSFSSMVDMLMHELKNPLAGIKGASQLLESDLIGNKGLIELTQLIQIETDRITSLLNRMEHITNDKLKLNCQYLNIHKVLNHCKRVAKNSFGVNIKFVDFYDPSLPEIFANRDLLIQIFLNIIKNSCEASNKSGVIKIKTSFNSNKKIVIDKDEIPISLPLQIEVIDNGSGISNELLPNIFDPFVSSKIYGKGLGLSIVASGLNEIGAIIDVNSTPGHTNICMNFPLNYIN